MMFIFFVSAISFNEVAGLICYCAGYCPSNQPNGSCFARPNSQCFSAVEEVHNPATGLLEFERTYGCLPPDESGFMQCKGHLVPHHVPKSIACCASGDWCNKYLMPTAVARTTTPSPMYRGELMSYTGPYHLVTFIVSVAICLMILTVVVVLIAIRFYKEKLNENGYGDVEKLNGDAVKNLIDSSADSSGSGSGTAFLAQRTFARQLEMVESIGRGRFGEVWKARWRDEWFAVKVFFTTEEASWAREIDIYKIVLQHDNILCFKGADIRSNGSWTQMLLITEYMEMGSLHDYLKVCMLDEGAMLKLAHSAACGLSYLHNDVCGEQGKPAIAHRDIKSKNILVKRDRTCAIADFGLAVKYWSEIEKKDKVCESNNRVGTIRYMSPEVLDETLDSSQFESYKMSDMYSFALVLWEIARRCIINGIIEDYQIPYYDCVVSNPSFEEMKKVICIDQNRPTIPEHWSTSELMQAVSRIIQESWHPTPGARLKALRVKKTLLNLVMSLPKNKLGDEKLV